MKVYIVTEGEYSDYHIERVFADREKAELYCKYHRGSKIEEWDTEEYEPEGYWEIFSSVIYDAFENRVHTNRNAYLRDETEGRRGHAITYGARLEIWRTTYRRENDFSEREAKDLAEKIAEDTAAEVKYMLSEGMSVEQIRDAFRAKLDEEAGE